MAGHSSTHLLLYRNRGRAQDRQATALEQVLQLFSQGLHRPDAPYWPSGHLVTHMLLVRNVPLMQVRQVSVVFTQVLQGLAQLTHCMIVSLAIWPSGHDDVHAYVCEL